VEEKLSAVITWRYKKYDQKATITVSPGVPAVKMQYAFKRNEEGAIRALSNFVQERVELPSMHYRLKTVRFFDQTDLNNNLVEETATVPFVKPDERQGNVLFGRSLSGNGAFFMLKEAPGHASQVHYPGYDFLIGGTALSMHGAGLTGDDLLTGHWVNAYASVVGVDVGDMGCNYSLRLYQKSIRKHLAERDDMIMLNTWGDRNRDQSINEAFCLREIDACTKYGFTHFQIDDGWQTGLSKNSASAAGRIWDNWEKEHWELHPERFPRGFEPIRKYAASQGVKMGLWFHPSNGNDYEHWKRDAEIIGHLYKNYRVKYFKIDGVKLPTKRAEVNFRNFLDHALTLCNDSIVFNLDVTADIRGGYHYFNEYGNIFLENRYTDWGNYYPHWTLRNLWQLSAYVPPEKIQIEFLNIWRNTGKYETDDPLAPSRIPFDYVFATTLAAQPLAWFEASQLPEEAEVIMPIVEAYKKVWKDFHKGVILPVGNMPSGYSWTGFQSLQRDEGYIVVFREMNPNSTALLSTHFQPGQKVVFQSLSGGGEDFEGTANSCGQVRFKLCEEFSFGLYRYRIARTGS
jgi:hypothetical protein